MGEEFVKVNGAELAIVTIYCHRCGIGHTINIAKPINLQFFGGTCTCNEKLSDDLTKALNALEKLQDAVRNGLQVEFSIKKT